MALFPGPLDLHPVFQGIHEAAAKAAKPAAKTPAPKYAGNLSGVPFKGGLGRVPTAKPAQPSRVFSQKLPAVTKQNMETGGALRQYAAEHPKPAAKPGFLEKALKVAGEGEHAVAGAGAWGLHELEQIPGVEHGNVLTRSHNESPSEKEEGNRRAIGVATAFAPGLGVLKGGRLAADTGRALEAAKGASIGSRALKVAGGAAAIQGKLMLGATAAKAANSATASNSKSLPSKLYNEVLQIGMGGPRAAVEAVERPGALAKGMAQVVTHPLEHPIGAALTAFGTLKGADTLAGTVAKTSTERASGVVGGVDQTVVPRNYSKGLVQQAAQKGVEKAKGAVGIDPNVLRTRSLPIYGSKVRKAVIGGTVKPGLTDLHRGNTNVVADLQAAKGHEFVEANRPAVVLRDAKVLSRAQARGDVGKAHDEAVMPFLEGHARTPASYWGDVSKREGQLLLARKGMTDSTARERNQAQIDQLRLIKEHQDSINTVGLPFHEAVARKIADAQAHSFHQELLEGHLHPDQFNARLIGFGLEHGDLLGRGQLHYVKEPGKDPIIAKVGELKKQLSDAKRQTQSAKEKLAQATGEAEGRGQFKRSVGAQGARQQVPAHYVDTLDKARALEQDARRQVQEGQKEIAHRKANGYMDHEGNSWQGLYDSSGQRVAGKDLRALYEKETEGRQPGFITHKEEAIPTDRGKFSSSAARPGVVARSRTGEHAMSGNYRNDFGVVHREFRRSARNLSDYRSQNQLVEQFGVQQHVLNGIDRNAPPQEQHSQMVELARELNSSPDKRAQLTKRELGEWTVVSRGPERVLNSGNIHDSRFAVQNQVGAAEGKAVLGKPGELKYTLIRKGVLDRLESHLAAEHPTSPILKTMKTMTGYQRHVALYSSPRWPVGVTQENAIRLAAQNTSPLVTLGKTLANTSRAYKVGKGYLEGLNKAAGNDLRTIEGDPRYSVPEKTMARTNAGMLEHGSMIGSEVRSMMNDGRSINQDLIDHLPEFPERVAGTAGVKQGLAAWNTWKEFLGNHLTNMENRTRTALAGHQLIKEYGTFSTEVKGLIAQEDKIVQQVVANKLDPVAATRFTEQLLDAAGNWSHLTPFTREMRTWFAPFGLWWLNSVKFMFKTMPVEHPLKTALWAALVSATKPDERPEFKQGSIHVNMPFVGGVDFSPIHYSPADIFHEWDKTGEKMVMPWFTEALARSAGINPLYDQSIYGRAESEGIAPANLKAAGESAAESFLPVGNIATSLIRGGGSPNEKGPFPSLEAQPGTQKGIPKTLAKFATPFPFTYTSKKEKEASGGRKESTRQEPLRKESVRKESVRKESVRKEG